MNSVSEFRPVWKKGLTLHIILGVLLTAGGGILLWLAFQQHIGGLLILCLFGTLLFLAALTFVVYRGYAVYHASYTIEREGLRIRWGLRKEDIPLTEIEWVHPVRDLVNPLKMPVLAMPGAYLGQSQHSELGPVEFIASDTEFMVIVDTINETFVLSPEKPDEFIQTFQRTLEMGSISPIHAFSAQPAEFIQSVLAQRYARAALISSILLTLVLAVLTSLSIPYHSTISMGITPQGVLMDPVPANRLLILPILATLSLAVDILLGLYLFRKAEYHRTAYALWIAGVVTPFLLLIALILMVY
jgi:hypothetical protein